MKSWFCSWSVLACGLFTMAAVGAAWLIDGSLGGSFKSTFYFFGAAIIAASFFGYRLGGKLFDAETMRSPFSPGLLSIRVTACSFLVGVVPILSEILEESFTYNSYDLVTLSISLSNLSSLLTGICFTVLVGFLFSSIFILPAGIIAAYSARALLFLTSPIERAKYSPRRIFLETMIALLFGVVPLCFVIWDTIPVKF